MWTRIDISKCSGWSSKVSLEGEVEVRGCGELLVTFDTVSRVDTPLC